MLTEVWLVSSLWNWPQQKQYEFCFVLFFAQIILKEGSPSPFQNHTCKYFPACAPLVEQPSPWISFLEDCHQPIACSCSHGISVGYLTWAQLQRSIGSVVKCAEQARFAVIALGRRVESSLTLWRKKGGKVTFIPPGEEVGMKRQGNISSRHLDQQLQELWIWALFSSVKYCHFSSCGERFLHPLHPFEKLAQFVISFF